MVQGISKVGPSKMWEKFYFTNSSRLLQPEKSRIHSVSVYMLFVDSFSLDDCWLFIKISNKKALLVKWSKYAVPKYANWHILFWLKGTWKTVSARKTFWLFLAPRKREINLPCERYPFCAKDRRHPYHHG